MKLAVKHPLNFIVFIMKTVRPLKIWMLAYVNNDRLDV